MSPFLAKKIVVALGADTPLDLILTFTFLFGSLWVLSKIATDVEEIVFFPVVNESIKDITYRTLEHLHRIPLGAQKYSSSEIISTIKRISLSARSFIKVFFLLIPRTILKLVLAAIILMQYHFYGVWILAALVLCFFALYRSIQWYVAARKKAWKCTDRVTQAIHDSILYTKTARFHQNFEMSRLGKSLKEEAKLWNATNTKLHATSGIITLIFGISFLGILMMMTYQGLSVGDFVMIKGLLLALFIPLRNISRQIRMTAESIVDIQNIIEILEIPILPFAKDTVQDPNPQDLFIRNLTFAYKEVAPIFQNVSLYFPAGEKVLLRGDTGAGKSTFCHLLSSLLQPTEGGVFLNNQSIQSFTKDDLGKTLIFIPQQAHVLNASVLENLTYGYDNLCQKQIDEVIQKVGLTPMINRLPKGLYTSIGERGGLSSGGERQKIALARALLLRPNILILDEATQSLDRENEKRILEHLFEVVPTIFVVSHQLEYFDRFDRILRFDSGKIFSEEENQAFSTIS